MHQQNANLTHLAQAIEQLFGPDLQADVQLDSIGFIWRGRSFGSAGGSDLQPETLALCVLNAAHDAVLEGMGEDGEDPGWLVSANCEIWAEKNGWVLALLTPAGEIKAKALLSE